jgi:magnesium chelatase family protein
VETQKLVNDNKEKRESSKLIQKRVQKARDFQLKRFKGMAIKSNSEMSTRDIKKYCEIDESSRVIMTSALSTMNLSARGYFKVIKIARTIADLSEEKNISSIHIAEALQYRPKVEN